MMFLLLARDLGPSLRDQLVGEQCAGLDPGRHEQRADLRLKLGEHGADRPDAKLAILDPGHDHAAPIESELPALARGDADTAAPRHSHELPVVTVWHGRILWHNQSYGKYGILTILGFGPN